MNHLYHHSNVWHLVAADTYNFFYTSEQPLNDSYLSYSISLLTGQEDDDTATVQSQPLPTDVFRLRQMRKARGIATSSQTPTGSTSYGSAFSGELSGSTG